MNRYADFLCTHRKLLAAVVAVVTAVALFGAFRVRYEDEPRNALRRRGAEFDRLEELYRDFGPDDNDVLVVVDGDELFTNESLSVIRQIVEQARGVDGVESVFSIFDMRWRGSRLRPLVPRSEANPEQLALVREKALSHPAVSGHLLSKDATTMIAVVRLSGDSLSIPYVEARIAQLQDIADNCSDGSPLRVRLAGHQIARVELTAEIWREGPRLLVLGGVISTLIAIALFRRLAAVLIAVAGPAMGVTWTLGVFGLAGEELNALSTALPTLVFVIGFTDSVHLVIDVRRKRAAGEERLDAVRDAIRDVGPACALTSLTTMVGFGSLVITEVEVVQRFGIDCACGTLLSFLAVIAVVPLLASTRLGDFMTPAAKTDASPKRKRGTANELPSLALRASDTTNDMDKLGPERNTALPKAVRKSDNDGKTAHRGYAWIVRYRWTTAAASLLISVGLLVTSLNLRPDIRWMEMLPENSETRQVWHHCDQELGGTLLSYVVVDWPADHDLNSPDVLRALVDVHALLAEEPMTEGPFSVVNLLLSFSTSRKITGSHIRQLDRVPSHVLDRLVRRDLRRAVVTAYVPDAGAAELLPVFSALESRLVELEARYPGFRIGLTGTSVVAARNVHRIIGDLGKSLALATIIIFVVMSVALRSIRLGLISAIPNAFPLAFAAALLAATGEPLRLASAMTFSICLGIAVDDTIHFLTRFRREWLAGGDVESSILRTIRSVGVAMLVTSATLLGGFSVMVISYMPSIQIFAQLASVAILAALFGDLIMLPALLACFVRSRKNETSSTTSSPSRRVDRDPDG